ncbi:MAG: hypothetical protein P3A30_06360 [Gemmatimonadota bacterium]|nr:hypothetical protein [Gemmatimonadota bacterium]
MIWIKLVDSFKFFSLSDGTKEYRTSLQNFGIRVKNVVYAIEVLDRSHADAKIGIRHDHGASDNLNLLVELGAPIALATASPPTTVKGQIGETTSAVLLPYFMPVVLAGTDSGSQWVVANIYVGGKPF